MIKPFSASFGWPTLPMELSKVKALNQSLRDAGFAYGLGSKISPLRLQATEVPEPREVDCSGDVRWIVFHANGELIPDGSFNQHEWFISKGFKHSTPESLTLHDGIIRVGILSPGDGGGVGHILLACNGETFESHGGKGPDSRPIDFAAHPWMRNLDVFVLSVP